ncbi:hypothetical protein E4V51_01910 [Paenibacillus sp. 28ISP30-2]|nr:hypothetical protein [Paenibacillus sp. 28ISP30-2]
MTYQAFKNNNSKEYLGFCEQKGFIYSLQLDVGRYCVIALQNGCITTLITYSIRSYTVCR